MISDAIQSPDAPGIPGLRFRHFRGGDDFRHMVTIKSAILSQVKCKEAR
jgi:hypothetical protein